MSGGIYLVCFLASFVVLLHVLRNIERYSCNHLLFVMTLAIGDGGYFALANSKNLAEAILAYKITYVIGCFVPMCLFFVVCEFCKLKLNDILKTACMIVQMLIYLCVCTIGYSSFYYKSIEFHLENGVAYLTKEYGPVHVVYVVMMALYFVAVIVVAAKSTKMKNRVSSKDLDVIIVLEFVSICCYLLERVVDFDFEIIPIVTTVNLLIVMFTIEKLQIFSITGNSQLMEEIINENGYIILDKKLHYCGCNEAASEVFPELLTWEIEKKIPGSGAKFNTYLRQHLVNYIDSKQTGKLQGEPFSIGDKTYTYSINVMTGKRNKAIGYVIGISNLSKFGLDEELQ